MTKDQAPDLGAFAFVPSPLDPRPRAHWYHGWAYGYSPTRNVADMPELWVLPKEFSGDGPSEKPASGGAGPK